MKDFELTPELCGKMAKAAEDAQREAGAEISLAIADRNGNLKYFFRFGDAILPSIEISQHKAYTAAVLRQSTGEFGKIAQVDGSAFGINVVSPRLVIFGGGFPLLIDGETVGGIGISGGSVEQDEMIAERVLEAFKSSVSCLPHAL